MVLRELSVQLLLALVAASLLLSCGNDGSIIPTTKKECSKPGCIPPKWTCRAIVPVCGSACGTCDVGDPGPA